MGKKGDASTGVGSSAEGGKPPTPERKRGAWAAKKAARKPVGKSGVPGSVNPERRCTAKANRTGERCRRAAIKGGTVCTVHGGNLPQVRKKAKERLLELVEPALASLQKVLTDPAADDATKVRAALGILDRTGHGPGAKLEVGFSKFDQLLEDAVEVGAQVAIERGSPPPSTAGVGNTAGRTTTKPATMLRPKRGASTTPKTRSRTQRGSNRTTATRCPVRSCRAGMRLRPTSGRPTRRATGTRKHARRTASPPEPDAPGPR